MLEQVSTALKSVKIEPKDQAAAALAKHYARLIDDAAPDKKYAEALEWLAGVDTNQRTDKFRLTIMTALSEHSSASDFGPKLLATLTALGMTPAAAGNVIPEPVNKPADPLDELRKRRQEREKGAS